MSQLQLMDQLDDHLRQCDQCADYRVHLETMNKRIKRGFSGKHDTSGLWSRVSAALDQEDRAPFGIPATKTPSEALHRSSTSRRAFLGMGIAASLVLVAVGSGYYRSVRKQPGQIGLETVNDFLTFRASGKKLDIAGDDPVAIAHWLAARVNFELPTEFALSGDFKLSGGRLCSFLNRRLVSLQYQRGDRDLSLYVMDAAGLDMPRGSTQTVAGRDVVAVSYKGVTNVAWAQDGLVFAAVSDMGQATVFDFIQSI